MFAHELNVFSLFTKNEKTCARMLHAVRAIKRPRPDANRLANCDANNIDKTIAASMRQTEWIQRLIDENKISFLPPELEATARLRLQYPGLSLVQLAAIADPPMTKSGLNHRLKKIMSAAAELLNEQKGDI